MATRGYHYLESGLSNVWLTNGYRVHETKHGRGVAVTDVDGLHRSLVGALLGKARLTGAEIRFLRKELGLSQRALGELIGVGEQAVALWERKGRMPAAADRLLRLIVAEHARGSTPVRALIARLSAADDGVTERIVARQSAGRWQAKAA